MVYVNFYDKSCTKIERQKGYPTRKKAIAAANRYVDRHHKCAMIAGRRTDKDPPTVHH